jgi:hypothetical protein
VSGDPSFTVFDPIAERTGGRFTLFTVMVTGSLELREPSETEKVTWYVPAWLYVGVQEKVLEPALKDAPDGRAPVE